MPLDERPASINDRTEETSEETYTVGTEPETTYVADIDTEEEIRGLSPEEYNDANRISVHIPTDKIPLVMLYGPPTSGKTMLLVRLVRYLQQKGYTASPVRTFRPAADKNYEEICSGFDRMIANDLAAPQTDLISFMLVEVRQQGRAICRILEVPGEHILPSGNLLAPYPLYFEEIANSNIRKIWLFILEPDWKDQSDRSLYVQKVQRLKSRMNSRDKSIFVFNKVDKTDLVRSAGSVNMREVQKTTENLYPGIFNLFRNENPITRFWRSHDCGFVPFQTGTYITDSSGSRHFSAGHPKFCGALWNAILRYIKG